MGWHDIEQTHPTDDKIGKHSKLSAFLINHRLPVILLAVLLGFLLVCAAGIGFTCLLSLVLRGYCFRAYVPIP